MGEKVAQKEKRLATGCSLPVSSLQHQKGLDPAPLSRSSMAFLENDITSASRAIAGQPGVQ
jgi:hypothetical protein